MTKQAETTASFSNPWDIPFYRDGAREIISETTCSDSASRGTACRTFLLLNQRERQRIFPDLAVVGFEAADDREDDANDTQRDQDQ